MSCPCKTFYLCCYRRQIRWMHWTPQWRTEKGKYAHQYSRTCFHVSSIAWDPLHCRHLKQENNVLRISFYKLHEVYNHITCSSPFWCCSNDLYTLGFKKYLPIPIPIRRKKSLKIRPYDWHSIEVVLVPTWWVTTLQTAAPMFMCAEWCHSTASQSQACPHVCKPF